MLFFYNVFLVLYRLGLQLASAWNPKARLWVEGRKSILCSIQDARAKDPRPLVWIHSSSLGEFEQGRPLIEAIRSRYPSYQILLTFFSPSGYEIRKNYPGADLVFYLPLDGPKTSIAFVQAIKPSLAIFIKYETWYYYLSALRQTAVPTLLVSAIFRPSQNFFGPFGSFLRGMLEQYDQLFLQDRASKTTLENAGVTVPAEIAGDTRFDRVTTVADQDFTHAGIEVFCKDQQVLVAGSTWPEDEVLLKELIAVFPTLKLVIAPHNVDTAHVKGIEDLFVDTARLSNLNESATSANTRVLILDQIGLLSLVYRFSTVCYIGGGFNTAGIHNVLEAVAYGRTVVFGVQHERAAEASALIELGVGFSIANAAELIKAVGELLHNPSARMEKNQLAKNFVESKTGATQRVMDFIAAKGILDSSKVLR